MGLGKISYPEFDTTIHDTGLVYSFGGGVDIDVAHNLMFKADYQSASWNMGVNSYTKPEGGDFIIFAYHCDDRCDISNSLPEVGGLPAQLEPIENANGEWVSVLRNGSSQQACDRFGDGWISVYVEEGEAR